MTVSSEPIHRPVRGDDAPADDHSERGPVDEHSADASGDDHRADDAVLDRFVDDADRPVVFERYRPERYGDVTAMYADFAPAHRAQGLPPSTDTARTEWLSVVLDERSVLAVHDDAVVGHAVLVGDDAGGHELGVFVHQDYQNAGVGTALLEATFDHARSLDVTDVWLTVACSNYRARHVYDELGFAEDATSGRSVRYTRQL
ncbi:GNAT family N-acetyltransferase [Halorubellus sp. PRR65]|uniref:GNAT family N-acetyltransferase n=1 Tax=Halorubellus sp. PRR65 TaxID=3098148 RepID=UPI002B257E0D|nr:GNAT family N-acetyltransferase [Halorubellus sp. PRR65]